MALNDIAIARKQSLASLVQMIDKERVSGLSSAIRVFIHSELRHQLAASTTTKFRTDLVKKQDRLKDVL